MEKFSNQSVDATLKSTFNHIIQKARKKTGIGKQYNISCPLHGRNPPYGDNNPSCTVTLTDDRILIYCHACSNFFDLNEFCKHFGIHKKDLFSMQTKIFVYMNEKNNPLYRVKKWRNNQGDTMYNAEQFSNGTWNIGLNGTTKVIYNLAAVIKAVNEQHPVYIVEGEKDVESLTKIGLVATTNVFGAGKWEDRYKEYFRNADVIILPDNDDPGIKHGEKVAQSLQSTAKSVKIVQLPNIPHKGDVSDWLAQGGTREQLAQLVQQTPLWRNSSLTFSFYDLSLHSCDLLFRTP